MRHISNVVKALLTVWLTRADRDPAFCAWLRALPQRQREWLPSLEMVILGK